MGHGGAQQIGQKMIAKFLFKIIFIADSKAYIVDLKTKKKTFRYWEKR